MTAECSGWPISMTDFSISVAVGQACTQAPQETHSESMKASGMARRDAAVEAAAIDRQRECALHFLAGAHAAIADDALRRIVGEIGVRLVLRCSLQMVLAFVAVAHLAQADGAGHAFAIRNCRWRRRSGSRADGRRYRAPSRRCAAPSVAASGYGRPCRARPAWCRRRACRCGLRSRRGRGGRSRKR